MVKSAARMLLSSGDDPGHLLTRLNEVLYPLKKPDMFVTFCFLAKSGDKLRVGLAGHPSILHFSAATNEVTRLECPNMPFGILPSADCGLLRVLRLQVSLALRKTLRRAVSPPPMHCSPRYCPKFANRTAIHFDLPRTIHRLPNRKTIPALYRKLFCRLLAPSMNFVRRYSA